MAESGRSSEGPELKSVNFGRVKKKKKKWSEFKPVAKKYISAYTESLRAPGGGEGFPHFLRLMCSHHHGTEHQYCTQEPTHA